MLLPMNSQRGSGSTELLAALRQALAIQSDADRARSFVVITDGYVTIEKEAMELVRANLGQANVFAFGIGSSVNRFLIEGLARAGRGEAFIVLDQKQASTEADRFRAYIEAPVLTHIHVAFNGVDAYDVDPPQVPDLFAQRPLVISGKFRGPPAGRIDVTGTTATGAFSTSLDLAANRQFAPDEDAGPQGLLQLFDVGHPDLGEVPFRYRQRGRGEPEIPPGTPAFVLAFGDFERHLVPGRSALFASEQLTGQDAESVLSRREGREFIGRRRRSPQLGKIVAVGIPVQNIGEAFTIHT